MRASQSFPSFDQSHLGEEEGDDNEPDDVVAESGKALREGQRLGGNHSGGCQEGPSACWQWLQHQACVRKPHSVTASTPEKLNLHS